MSVIALNCGQSCALIEKSVSLDGALVDADSSDDKIKDGSLDSFDFRPRLMVK